MVPPASIPPSWPDLVLPAQTRDAPAGVLLFPASIHACLRPRGPTAAAQALRQSLLKKYSSVRGDLNELHNSRMSAYEKAECLESIRAEIQSAWRTDEIRRAKPSPQVLHSSPSSARLCSETASLQSRAGLPKAVVHLCICRTSYHSD